MYSVWVHMFFPSVLSMSHSDTHMALIPGALTHEQMFCWAVMPCRQNLPPLTPGEEHRAVLQEMVSFTEFSVLSICEERSSWRVSFRRTHTHSTLILLSFPLSYIEWGKIVDSGLIKIEFGKFGKNDCHMIKFSLPVFQQHNSYGLSTAVPHTLWELHHATLFLNSRTQKPLYVFRNSMSACTTIHYYGLA